MTIDELTSSATAFVAEAERMTNQRDVDGIRAILSEDAHQIATVDGLVIESHGCDEIHRAWARMCAFMEARQVFVTKTLVTTDENTIVNEWVGELAGQNNVRGIEVWKLDDAGMVVEQRLYGFLDARPETSVIQSLRMLVAQPLTALSLARARSRA